MLLTATPCGFPRAGSRPYYLCCGVRSSVVGSLSRRVRGYAHRLARLSTWSSWIGATQVWSSATLTYRRLGPAVRYKCPCTLVVSDAPQRQHRGVRIPGATVPVSQSAIRSSRWSTTWPMRRASSDVWFVAGAFQCEFRFPQVADRLVPSRLWCRAFGQLECLREGWALAP